MELLESLFSIQKSCSFFHPPVWADDVMTGALAAIVDHQDEGHNLMVERGAGRSVGPHYR